jgi:hypothetical protein
LEMAPAAILVKCDDSRMKLFCTSWCIELCEFARKWSTRSRIIKREIDWLIRVKWNKVILLQFWWYEKMNDLKCTSLVRTIANLITIPFQPQFEMYDLCNICWYLEKETIFPTMASLTGFLINWIRVKCFLISHDFDWMLKWSHSVLFSLRPELFREEQQEAYETCHVSPLESFFQLRCLAHWNSALRACLNGVFSNVSSSASATRMKWDTVTLHSAIPQ